MDGSVIGFIVWALFGCFMIGLGISAFFSKKAVGFWANFKFGRMAMIRKAKKRDLKVLANLAVLM